MYSSLEVELIFRNLGIRDAGEIQRKIVDALNKIDWGIKVNVQSVTITKAWLIVIIELPFLPLTRRTTWLINAIGGQIVIALNFNVRYRQFEIHKRTSSLLYKKEWRKPKIALCVIAKDEAPYIGEFLDHIKDWVDDMVVIVDERTVDSTADEAKKHGARVFFGKWENDFSKLRNLAIEKADPECEWILSLDVDERASTELILNLRELTQTKQYDAYEFKLINEVTGTIEPKIRLFRRYCRWKGIVHEQIQGYKSLCKTDFKIFHKQRWIAQGGKVAEERNAFYRKLEKMGS